MKNHEWSDNELADMEENMKANWLLEDHRVPNAGADCFILILSDP